MEEDEQGVTVNIMVQPNFELIQKIMMQYQGVKMLQPQWLAEEVKKIYLTGYNH